MTDDLLFTDKSALVEYFVAGNKPREAWRVGTEHEKFVFRTGSHSPLPYEGPDGIGEVLYQLQRFGWEAVREGEHIIGLKGDGESITLEPGGQFELSGAPLKTMHETCAEVHRHLVQVKSIGAELDIGFLGLGMLPKWERSDVPMMPKGRYKIMREYMPKRGTLGLDMMFRSCTVQANLDYGSEADMVRKMRVSLAFQPVATAIFANSPFTGGKPNGYMSFRSHLWTDTDPDRCGTLPFAFDESMSFERYVDYALTVPMYFLKRDGIYHDVTGASFRDFMQGRLSGFEGVFPTESNWEDHISTIFPEVRLKRYLEMRGVDGGSWRRICALPALWTGLLYDDAALSKAHDIAMSMLPEEREYLRLEVPKRGLRTPFRDGTVLDLAKTMVELSRAGLARRNFRDGADRDETRFLEIVERTLAIGISPARELLNSYQDRWQRTVDPVYDEESY
jgi:glutamate--cysteine ligase